MSHFDAFKFPSSEVVQFRALVTPCMPACEPVQCDEEESTGEVRSVISYGKRRRRRSTNTDDSPREGVILEESIKITDKFGFERENNLNINNNSTRSTLHDTTSYLETQIEELGFCMNIIEVVIAGSIFFQI